MANKTLSDEDQLAGNAEDSLNPGSDRSKELFDKKGNATSDDLASLEANLDKKYSQDFDAVDNGADRQAIKASEENPEQPKSLYAKDSDNKKKSSLSAKLLAGSKRFGPTGGVIGIILAAFGITSGFAGPASLLVALSDLTSNHTGLSNHLFLKSGTSYVASFLKGETRDCSKSKIKCKFTTISEERKAEWEKRGIKVDAPTKNSLGRYIVRGLEYKGTPVNSIRQYKNLRYTNPEFNSLLKRYPVRAYLLDKSPFRKGTLEKFGKNLSDKFKSSQKKEKSERVSENNKAMNDKTSADVDENGNINPKKTEEKANKDKAKIEKLSDKLSSSKTAFKVASGTAAVTSLACTSYNLVRVVQASAVLIWHQELLDFVLPFMQAGAQAKESGVNDGFDWATAEYFGDRLTQPITQKDIDSDQNDDLTQDMLGKTAMDSKGIDAVINGGHASIKDGYASKYNGWMPAGLVIGSGIISQIQQTIGKENIRDACQGAQVVQAATQIAQCAAKLLVCAVTFAGTEIITNIWGQDILETAISALQKPALDAIANANLSSSLHGPPLGQALVSGAGVMSSYMDNASGFIYAGSDSQAITAYNNMYGDSEYIAEMKDEAAKNQFDRSNPYSFASLALSKLTNMNWDGTLFSSISNIVKTTINSPLLLTSNAMAMQQGLYQPVEIYSSTEKIQGTLNNCQNPGLREVGIPCLGESGRAVPTFSPEVQSCMNQEANGGKLCIETAIDKLSSYQYKGEDDKQHPYIDEVTGEPSDWTQLSKEDEKDFNNPFMMFMQYCGRDRKYPLGYTDKDIEVTENKSMDATEIDNWHTGINCAAGKNKNIDDTKLGWMSYYYHMCIAMYASEEDQDYCWDEAATPNNGDVCSLLNNPHIHYEQKATEEDLKKLCAGQTVQSYCGNNITINKELINTLVSNSKKYDITINNFGFADDRHVSNDCQPGKQHWKGNAVDISKVSLVGSSGGAGNGTYGSVSYAGANGSLLSQYASDFLSGISGNRGGVGQKGCSSTFNPTFPAGSTNVNGAAFFEDSCDHLHIDVRDRTNISGL